MKQKCLTVQAGWELIQEIGWGTKTTDYKAIAQEYFAKLGKDGMALLEKFVSERRSQLSLTIDSWEETNGKLELGSDDGYSDLTYHIIGLGSDEFERVMANPRLAEERAKAYGYKESFAYCFQQPDPPRTEAQKRGDLKLLLSGVEKLEKEIAALDTKLSKVRVQTMDLALRARKVAGDITAKE